MNPRCILELGFLVIFSYSLYGTIEKVIENPQVNIISTKDISEVDKPRIKVCAPNQFEYSVAKTHGYNGLADFWTGINENYPGRASWQIDANHTYNETVNSLFQGSEPVNVSFEHHGPAAKEFTMNKGFCHAIDLNSDHLYIKSQKDVSVFVVDPAIDIIDLKMIEGDEKMRLRHDSELGYVTSVFEISVRQLVIQSEQDSCKQYTTEHPYYQCLVDKIREVTGMVCEPPYMKNLDATLDNPCTILPNISKEVQDQMLSFWKKYTNGQLYELGCEEPCTKTTYHISMIADNGGSHEMHWIKLLLNTKVEYIEQRSSFSTMNLFAEVGGNISLWMNLSFIGVYDLCTFLVRKLKRKEVIENNSESNTSVP